LLHSPEAHAALLSLLAALDADGYDFVTPTPATHARVVARPDRREARTLRDIFGWSLPFARDLLPAPLFNALERSDAIERSGEHFMAKLRVSRVGGSLYLHSAYPTDGRDAVFLGPDTYRFADFIAAQLGAMSSGTRIVDLGAGSGVGAITAGLLNRQADLTLVDVNRDALFLAGINAEFAGVPVTLVEADSLAGVADPLDLVLANPPFIMDADGRAYRDGGDMHGARLSFDWAVAAAGRLTPGGRLLLYTGSAIVDGRDGLRDALAARSNALGCTLDYREIDPDIFGEELDEPPYADVERIAAVGVILTKNA
jgi:methylase of polypeptide subunit release factors